MQKKATLQVQAILYKNDTVDLIRSLEKLANAVRVDRITDTFLSEVTLVWGDASPSPVFTDEEIAALNQRFGETLRVRYVYFNENTGYGKGHNRLAADATSTYLMIENPDIVIAGDYFHHMLSPFREASVGLTEARQTPIEHPKKYDPITLETPWASGACFIIPTALYRSLKGFDDVSFFMYSEDVDLSLRIRRAGKRLIYQPAAPVYHAKHVNKHGSLTHTDTETRYSAEAQMVLAYKWNKPTLVYHLLHTFENGNDLQKEAAASFRRRMEAHELTRLHRKTDLYDEDQLDNRFSL